MYTSPPSDEKGYKGAQSFNLPPTCSGTETIPGPAKIVLQDPPGKPPFDQPGFVIGKTAVDFAWGISTWGAFSQDRLSVAGEFSMVLYPGCRTILFKWSAKRL